MPKILQNLTPTGPREPPSVVSSRLAPVASLRHFVPHVHHLTHITASPLHRSLSHDQTASEVEKFCARPDPECYYRFNGLEFKRERKSRGGTAPDHCFPDDGN